jgi:predicted 3-demethylubiquinone-9 3-methyltransferase (glyoxalase superfamily)
MPGHFWFNLPWFRSLGTFHRRIRKMASAMIRPFLMFEGKAEEAMNFYVSLFPGAQVLDIARYGPGQPGPEGTVMKASFTVGG